MRRIYLCQVNWSNCSGNAPGLWIPYSVGSLWAKAGSNSTIAEHYELAGLLFQRVPPAVAINSFDEPFLCGFSTYVWNEQFNLALARLLKERWPQCVIVFGGPQVPDEGYPYLERHPFIDALVHSEGETTFEALLLALLECSNNFAAVEGITYRSALVIESTPRRPRQTDLELLPSPYLTGVFDSIIAANPGADWNAVIETNRGCPYQCTFCDWGTLTYSKVAAFPLDRVYKEIEWLARNRIRYVLPADANFGIFPDRDSKIADAFIECKHRYNYPESVGMNFAKNSNRRIATIAGKLHRAGLLKALTLSLQSLSSTVLEEIKRKNMSFSKFSEILADCAEQKVPTYTELILGLPGETLSSWKQGLTEALEAGQHDQLETWLLELLPNTPLARPDSLARYSVKYKELVNYSFVIDADTSDGIPERIPIVYQTADMSFDDFKSALGFSYIIYDLHAFGWTQFLSRYLAANYQVSYWDFYNRLEAWILSNPGSILRREYDLTIRTFDQMISSGSYLVPRELISLMKSV